MCSLSRLADIKIRLNDRVFGRSSRHYWDNQALQPVAGAQNWFGEFRPVNTQGLAFMSTLLVLFRVAYMLPL
jgi:hypothetical protein